MDIHPERREALGGGGLKTVSTEVAGTQGRADPGSVTASRVPFVDLKVQARELREEYDGAIWSVIDRAAYTLGPELEEFEAAFAELCGCTHAVGVSSGTDAVKLALLGAGVLPGDEVIVPANTFIATAEAVSHIGAQPVFVDCLEGSGLIDPAAIGPAVTSRTTAVVAVHLYGQPCDMDAVQAIAAGCHGRFFFLSGQ
jgi:dTDP-4-amino-4,6-dideoxygalactose transaminase